MITIYGRNVNTAYIRGMKMLSETHTLEASRNGPVLVAPEPVCTHYDRPTERVLFDAQRDANPFFHLIESLWMLDGRRHLEPLTYYVPRMADFSDDRATLHGAYGYRWRMAFDKDQIETTISMLQADPTTRRAVISMWNPDWDLNTPSKDLPCNVLVTVQIQASRLNMVVFNRSNDAIFGHYGANVVHFSVLQEYMAAMIGCDVGWYEQVSSNFHAYEKDWTRYWPLARERLLARPLDYGGTHEDGPHVLPLVNDAHRFNIECGNTIDAIIQDKALTASRAKMFANLFFHQVVSPMTEAYKSYRSYDEVQQGIDTLDRAITKHGNIDWLLAGRWWLLRRLSRRQADKLDG